jgi:hypothetical protein
VAHIVEHLSLRQLETRYRASQDATEARHLQAIWLLAQGRTVLEVAEVLAFVPRWVEQLAARYNASGPEALGDQRRRNGRPASLLIPPRSVADSDVSWGDAGRGDSVSVRPDAGGPDGRAGLADPRRHSPGGVAPVGTA